jgi:hypothetical protein
MNALDAMGFTLLAIAAVALIAYRRRTSARREANHRMARSMRFAIESEAFAQAVAPQKRLLRRAS